MSRLERLVVMMEEINGGRYPNVDKFCRMFEVQKRTVYEDVRELKDGLRMEIEFDRFRGGYFNKNPKKQLPKFELTDGEIFALTLGKEMLSQYTGTSFEPILQTALEKIYERLPDKVQVDLNDLKSQVKINAGPVIQINRKMFFDLNRACEKHHCVEIEYFTASRGEVTDRRIDPYRLLENRGTWYLLAYCQLRNDLRLFALHRIQEYSLCDEKFKPVAKEKIDEYLQSAFFLEHTEKEHRLRIRFDRQGARYIRERKWHPSQKLIEHEDGGCTLSFVTPSLDEAKRWILTFGEEAEVLEPLSLRQDLARELFKMSKKYSI